MSAIFLQLSIQTDAEGWNLRLFNPEHNTERIVPLEFLIDNKKLSAKPDGMEFREQHGNLLRVRGRGRASLRFRFDNIMQFENACAREDDGIESAFIRTGKLLFVPLKGALWHNAMWLPEKAQVGDYVIDLLPPVETLEFEAAIHAYYSNGLRDDSYPSFDSIGRKDIG